MDPFNEVASRRFLATMSEAATRRAPSSPAADTNGVVSDGPRLDTRGSGGNGGAKQSSSPVFRGRRVQLIYVFIDVCSVVISDAVAFFFRFHPTGWREVLEPWHMADMDHHYAGFLLLNVALILLFCHGQHLYRTPLDRPASAESIAVLRAVCFATLLLTAFIYLSGVKIVSRLVVGIGAALSLVALVAWRYAKRRFVIHRIEQGVGARNALIVGAGRVGQALAELFEDNKLLGYRFIGFLDEDRSTDARTLGGVDDIYRIARTQFVDEVFVTIPSERELVKRLSLAARRQQISVKVIPDLYDGLGWNAPLRRLGRFPVMDLHWEPLPSLGLVAKRVIDTVFSALGLILCAPVFFVLAVLIKCDSPGRILYRSMRVGRKGRIFECYKLRTMVIGADELKDSLRDRNERTGPFFKISKDPRVTRSGRFLRKYSLDELPQLWNVLAGDMSLVGPRPHPLDDCEQYGLDDLRRLEVKPGITGLWQVTARQDPSFETNMRLDLEYIENWNLRLDLEIMMRTLASVTRAEGC